MSKQQTSFVIHDNIVLRNGLEAKDFVGSIQNFSIIDIDSTNLKTGAPSNSFIVVYNLLYRISGSDKVVKSDTYKISIAAKDLSKNLYTTILTDAKPKFSSVTDK